ncbi:MAG: PQQ-binding-like beta-propeller repeat protein [Tannerella sp.]|nr:PQQ-binding-like beta-propeller repeat protein [Tannerella sp.]
MYKSFFIIAVFLPFILLSCQQQKTPENQPTMQDWQWRGEHRDGIYNETGLLKEWPADGPELLWSYEGLGDGHTSVAISNEKIYVTGMREDSLLLLYVFDMAGNKLAEKEIGKEWNKNWNGTRSSVCINDGKLYIFSALGELYCLDEATLNTVWTKNILTDFDGRNLEFGMAENPLIVGDKIFMTPGGIVNNMIALNKNTGELIWTSPGLGATSAYCSPQLITGYDVPIIVTNFLTHIIGFNADTGEMLWSYPQESKYGVHPNTLLYDDGKIFSSVCGGAGAMLLRLSDDGRSVELAWKNEMDNEKGGYVKVGDCVYGTGDDNRAFFCIDWQTGETKYREREIAPGPVIAADGMIYCYDEPGKVYLIAPNPERLEVVSSFDVPLGTNQHWAHPVIYDGVLYIRHGDALMAYQIKNKEK